MESNLFSSRSNSHGVRSAGFFWHDVLFGAMDWRQYAGGIMVNRKEKMKMTEDCKNEGGCIIYNDQVDRRRSRPSQTTG